jgi:hypothetical protein
MKRESSLKSAFFKELRSQLPHFYVLQYATAAAPDRTIIGAGRQTNWEFKHGTPDFVSHGNQELLCCRLAVAGHCRYVVWQELANGTGQRTMIVHPRTVHERVSWRLDPEEWCVGYNHKWLVDRIKEAHKI